MAKKEAPVEEEPQAQAEEETTTEKKEAPVQEGKKYDGGAIPKK